MFKESGSEEEVANSISGGGFSAFFLRPTGLPSDYQGGAVANFFGILGSGNVGLYKCVHSPWPDPIHSYLCNLHSPKGRGVPDIALQSSKYQLVFTDLEHGDVNQMLYEASGTSCSTNVHFYYDTYSPPSFLRYMLPIFEHEAELRCTDRGSHLFAT
jgi:hypothetical protein